jgi:hypothetical protein
MNSRPSTALEELREMAGNKMTSNDSQLPPAEGKPTSELHRNLLAAYGQGLKAQYPVELRTTPALSRLLGKLTWRRKSTGRSHQVTGRRDREDAGE